MVNIESQWSQMTGIIFQVCDRGKAKFYFLVEKQTNILHPCHNVLVKCDHHTHEPPLGVILEQGACPLRPKGARSKAKNKKGARSRKRVILEQGAEIFQTKEEQGAENSNHGARNTLYHDCALKNLRLRRLPSYFSLHNIT